MSRDSPLASGCRVYSVHTCESQRPPAPQTLPRLLGRPRRGTQVGSRWPRGFRSSPASQTVPGQSLGAWVGRLGSGVEAPAAHPTRPLLFWATEAARRVQVVLGDHGGLGRVTTPGRRYATCPLRPRRAGWGACVLSWTHPARRLLLQPAALPAPAWCLQVGWPNLIPGGSCFSPKTELVTLSPEALDAHCPSTSDVPCSPLRLPRFLPGTREGGRRGTHTRPFLSVSPGGGAVPTLPAETREGRPQERPVRPPRDRVGTKAAWQRGWGQCKWRVILLQTEKWVSGALVGGPGQPA